MLFDTPVARLALIMSIGNNNQVPALVMDIQHRQTIVSTQGERYLQQSYKTIYSHRTSITVERSKVISILLQNKLKGLKSASNQTCYQQQLQIWVLSYTALLLIKLMLLFLFQSPSQSKMCRRSASMRNSSFRNSSNKSSSNQVSETGSQVIRDFWYFSLPRELQPASSMP